MYEFERIVLNVSDKLNRPVFPKRAIITAGMPYGNKNLHFGHIGGVFVPADAFARFLRDRIGKENVIFISGTDCYGSPIEESYRKAAEAGFEGTIEDFVRGNHDAQKRALDGYDISLDIFEGSGLDDCKEMHERVTDDFLRSLYEKGYLRLIGRPQFFDKTAGVFLNGRQVVGRCPVQGCKSEAAYADECSLGHQYPPEELIAPKSTLTGERPQMVEVKNWYFDLEGFGEKLKEYVASIEGKEDVRPVVTNIIKEFLNTPCIFIKKEYREEFEKLRKSLPQHKLIDEENKDSFVVEFKTLDEMNSVTPVLAANGIRYRTGKTLVPFRITGNAKWSVPAPKLQDEDPLTVWVWPESLWAPISFTAAYLKRQGRAAKEVKDFWCSKDSKVYQFIGSDNVYFYSVAEMAMFMAQQERKIPTVTPEEGELTLPTIVANNHILFLNKKASSSGAVKPPMAEELLNYYTAEQLRAHFLSLGLSLRSVSFQPKVFNPSANPTDADPVLKEGNLLTNVLNRLARSCFYTSQKYFDGRMVTDIPDDEVTELCENTVLEYERDMYRFELHSVMSLLDNFIRTANKYWVSGMNPAEKADDMAERKRVLYNGFRLLRTAMVLVHPIAPKGTEMLRDYLGVTDDFFNWERIFDDISDFVPEGSQLRELPPKTDFFARHESQFN